MKSIPMNVNSLKDLPECWLYANQRYVHYPVSRDFNLPFMPLESEELLQELNIQYQKVPDLSGKEILEVMDKDIFKEYDLTLPVYIKIGNSFKYAKKYTGKVPTSDSLQAARKVIKKIGMLKNERKTVNFLRKKISGSKAIIILNSSLITYKEDLVWNNDHFKVLPVINSSDSSPSPFSVVFDVNNIELNDSITITVSKRLKGLVVGKGGSQVKRWCKKLGLKRISVVDN